MKVLVLAGQKGGAGKTTVAVHLAIEAARQGSRVAVIDADPQGSAKAWADARSDETVPLAHVPVGQVADAVNAARGDGFDLVVVDTPPHAMARIGAVLRLADFIVLPVQPSVLDLAALPAALELVQQSEVPFGVVLSAAPHGVGETADVRKSLEAADVFVFETVVALRMAFRRAIAQGQSVSEFEPAGKAAKEIRSLWREIRQKIGEGVPA